jgi:hypothetical protein
MNDPKGVFQLGDKFEVATDRISASRGSMEVRFLAHASNV